MKIYKEYLISAVALVAIVAVYLHATWNTINALFLGSEPTTFAAAGFMMNLALLVLLAAQLWANTNQIKEDEAA